jgi:hypothetical protein
MKIITAPEKIELGYFSKLLFLGGTIDQGNSEDWQKRLIDYLGPTTHLVVANPRRADWDPTWPQDPTPGTEFHKQVTWELEAQDAANLIVYYFAPGSVSPITLLELGVYGPAKRVLVYCPKEFWRYGNVKMVCQKYAIPIFEDEERFLQILKEWI